MDFDLVVIGAGTAGLACAYAASGLGGRVALVESDRIGGHCLWTGAIPTACLIRSARVLSTVKRAEEFGVHVEATRPVWPAVRMRIAAVRDEIKALNRTRLADCSIELVTGRASFIDANSVRVISNAAERTLRAARFVVATGSRPALPAIDGLESCGCITQHQLFNLNPLPRSMVLWGCGPVACELAQALAELGCKVTMAHGRERLLPDADDEISRACARVLEQVGVAIRLQAQARRAGRDEDGRFLEIADGSGGVNTLRGAQLLVVDGADATLDGLEAPAAGVQSSMSGVLVDDYLRTTAETIYACGDVTGPTCLPQLARCQGSLAAHNALSRTPRKADYRALPQIVLTEPEIASIGPTEAQARLRNLDVRVFRAQFKNIDRAVIDGNADGFAKIVTSAGRVAGAHLIGASAGESIHALVPAVREGAPIEDIAQGIFGYPSLAEVIGRAAAMH